MRLSIYSCHYSLFIWNFVLSKTFQDYAHLYLKFQIKWNFQFPTIPAPHAVKNSTRLRQLWNQVSDRHLKFFRNLVSDRISSRLKEAALFKNIEEVMFFLFCVFFVFFVGRRFISWPSFLEDRRQSIQVTATNLYLAEVQVKKKCLSAINLFRCVVYAPQYVDDCTHGLSKAQKQKIGCVDFTKKVPQRTVVVWKGVEYVENETLRTLSKTDPLYQLFHSRNFVFIA